MRGIWCWSLISLTAFSTITRAATIVEHSEIHEFQSDGSIVVSVERTVRIEQDRDIDTHSLHVVYLDDNIELDKISLRATTPAGKTIKAKRRDRDELDLTLGGNTHDSSVFHAVALPKSIPVGSTVHAAHITRTEPYFPSKRARMTFRDRVESYRFEISNAPEGLRWHSRGDVSAFRIEETPTGLLITAEGLEPPASVEWAGAGAPWYPELRYAWGSYTDWQGVGRWYEELTETVERDTATVLAQANTLTEELAEPVEMLETLLDFSQRQVRYVAVEVGVGGYRPSHPAETLERRWGDCKDKSFLLVDMLDEAGIESYPALILSSNTELIDPGFPDMSWFNHVIVAVTAQPWMPDDWPVSGGHLFIDPTQPRGGARWLSSSKQGQHALIVKPAGGSQLVAAPVLPALESRDLQVELRLSGSGDARGTARYRMTGGTAASLIERMAQVPSERTEADLRDLLSDLMPGGLLSSISWVGDDTDLPTMTVEAEVELPGLLQGARERPSFQLGSFQRSPEPKLLTERDTPVVLRPIRDHATWRIALPDERCSVENKSREVRNEVGSFHHTIEGSPGQIVVTRDLEMRRRQVEVDSIEELRSIALAEVRAGKRRIRLSCK